VTWHPATIGCSQAGRPITTWSAPCRGGDTRVLVVAGQHGDERRAVGAAEGLLKTDPRALPCETAVIPVLNPDGWTRRTRENACGIDLNRDHLLLEAPETRALHGFVRSWRPDVVIDLHNYPSRRRLLLADGLVLPWDVCVDVPTHPAAVADTSILDLLIRTLGARGLQVARYTLVRPDRLTRHSTPYPHDLRNVLALRYHVATVLLEGRSPTRLDDRAVRARLRTSLDLALRTALTWAVQRRRCPSAAEPQPGERVPVRWRWRTEERPARFVVWNAVGGHADELTVQRYAASAAPRRQVALPEAYAVPADARHLVSVLERQQFEWTVRNEGGEQWLVMPVTQRGGRTLAVLLEPTSRNRLERRPELQGDLARVRPLVSMMPEGGPR